MFFLYREKKEQEQRERDRLDKERMERDRRDKEERDRRERDRAEKMERERRERQAREEVNRHFQLSMELAQKVSLDSGTHYQQYAPSAPSPPEKGLAFLWHVSTNMY